MSLTNRNIIKVEHSLNTARYSLTAMETDIILKMVAEIRNEDIDFKPYTFKVIELEEYFGKQINRRTLKETARNLMKKPLTIEQEDGGFLVCNWVSSFVYSPKDGEIELQFSPYLKPYLLQLKESYYLKGDMRQILQLPSEYAKRIYMILKQWEIKGNLEVEVTEWQKSLEVPKSMMIYNNFKRQVLEIAVHYINEKSDLIVSYEERKTGRKVTRLIWKIRAKARTKQDELPKFKAWFLKGFKGYNGLFYELYEGHIFLNDRNYFYDGMDKKKKFSEDEIIRIWQQLLDRKEDLKAKKQVWELWREQQKTLKEKPLFEDIETEDIEVIKEPDNTKGFFQNLFKKIRD